MSEIRFFRNEHGVLCCDGTERTGAPFCLTRMRFGGFEAYVAPQTMAGGAFVRPLFRGPNTFGMSDGGDAA